MARVPSMWQCALLALAIGCGDRTSATAPAPSTAPAPAGETAADARGRAETELQRLREELVQVDAKLAVAVTAVANATTDRDLTAAKLQVALLQRDRAGLQIRIIKIERMLVHTHPPQPPPSRTIDPECLKRAFSPRCR